MEERKGNFGKSGKKDGKLEIKRNDRKNKQAGKSGVERRLDKKQFISSGEKKSLEAPKKAMKKKHSSLCAVSRQCGGCQMLDMPYDKQLALKQKQIETCLLYTSRCV